MTPLPPRVRGALNLEAYLKVWGIILNDYGKGALEALVWFRSLMDELRKNKDWEKLKREVDEAREELLSGIAVDFREKLRPH